jgi:ribonuclease J
VPVHGEWRHLTAHAALAMEAGASAIVIEDGDILNLTPGTVEVIDSAPVGRLVVDGNRLVPIDAGVMSARRRMMFNGVAIASLAVDAAGKPLGAARLSVPGVFDHDDPEVAAIGAELARSVEDLPAPIRREDAALIEAARTSLRRLLGRRLKKRPLVDVHLLRV